MPFGDGQSCTGPVNPSTKHFTGKERDSETGNDYFGARYYSSTSARWVIPDWSNGAIPVPYANYGNPQTLNAYSYVQNNPVNLLDADGHVADPNGSVRSGTPCDKSTGDCTGHDQPVDDGAAEPEPQKQQQQYQTPDANNQRQTELANVTYNETSGIRANPSAKPGAPDSTEKLHAARLAVAEIANRLLDSSHPEREQAPRNLTSRTVHDLNAGNRDIIAAHNDSLAATKQAMAGSNTTNGAMHFRTGTHKFKELYGKKATMYFGPFPNAQGGTVYLTVAP